MSFVADALPKFNEQKVQYEIKKALKDKFGEDVDNYNEVKRMLFKEDKVYLYVEVKINEELETVYVDLEN